MNAEAQDSQEVRVEALGSFEVSAEVSAEAQDSEETSSPGCC